MIRLFLWLLQLPKESQNKSGKREVAIALALFTAALTIWGFASFTESGRISVITTYVIAATTALGGAFGLHALVKQGGLSFKKGEGDDDDIGRS